MGRAILITGRPGVGKTTLIQALLAELKAPGGGFYTAEIRRGGRREGFKIITLDGREGVLAHEDIKGPPRVGHYGVNIADLDQIGVAAVVRALADAEYIIIDEIGKMELTSPQFREAVKQAMASDKAVIATVMAGPHPFVDALKKRPRVILVEISLANRQGLKDEILKMLRED